MHEQARNKCDWLRNVKDAKGKGSNKLKKGDGKIHDVQALTPRSKEETQNLKLKEICALISTTTLPASTLSPKHLLLTIAPHTTTLPEHILDFKIIAMSKGCRFQADAYSLPFFEEGLGKGSKGGIVICGLDTWDLKDRKATPQIVGGTFNFWNIPSASAYSTLANVLPHVRVGHNGKGGGTSACHG